MSNDAHAIQNPPQLASAPADDLALKSVGKAKLVVVYHRDAYGVPAPGLEVSAA